MIYESREFPWSCAEAAVKRAEERDMEVVLNSDYPKGAEDLSPLLRKLKDLNPDMIIGGGYLPDSLLIVRQLKELDVNADAIALLVGPPMPDFEQELGKDANYVFGPAQWESGVRYHIDYGMTGGEFVRKIEEKYGHAPEYHHAAAYASCLVLQKAIEDAGTLESAKIRDVCSKLDFYTFFGRFKIEPETGLQIGHKMVIIQWQSDKKAIVYPPEVADAAPIYPMPAWDERR